MSIKTIVKSAWLEKKRHLNFFKTIYFNFKVFNFADALKLPVFLYGDISLEGLKKGSIKLLNVKRRSVIIGGGWYTDIFGYAKLYKTFIRIKGSVTIGNDVKISQGCILSVSKGAVLTIGNNVIINANTKIHAKEKIEIGENCRIGWNCQVFDTNFHYTISKGKLFYRNSAVFIGHNTWIPNNVSVMKGSYLPPYSIVGGNSLVNKDFSNEPEKSFFAGMPAKCLGHEMERILGKEVIIDSLFKDGEKYVVYDNIKEYLE